MKYKEEWMKFKAILSVAIIVLFVSMMAIGCDTTGSESGGQRQDSHSGHSHWEAFAEKTEKRAYTPPPLPGLEEDGPSQ